MVGKTDARGLEDRFEARIGHGAVGVPEILRRVLEAAGPVRGLRALEVGCGTGELSGRLEEAGARVAGIDVCRNLLARSREGAPSARFVRADAQVLPFRKGAFDLATCVLVLHYLDDPGRALAEIARVLRPGGRLVLADRIASADPELRGRQEALEHLRNPLARRLLTSGEMAGTLHDAGFDVVAEKTCRESVPLDRWLAGTTRGRARRLREELSRGDLGGLRVTPGGEIQFRWRLAVARRGL